MGGLNVWGGIGGGSNVSSAASITGNQIAYQALRLLGVLRPGAGPSPEYLSDCQQALNQLVDSWSLDRLMVYAISREQFSLIPGQADYTLGSAGDFVSARPPMLERASVLVPSGYSTVTTSTPGTGGGGGGGTIGDGTWDGTGGTFDALGGTFDNPDLGSGGGTGGGETTVTTTSTVTSYTEVPLEPLVYDQWQRIGTKGNQSTYPVCFYYEASYPLGVFHVWPTPAAAYPVVLGTWQQVSYFDSMDTPYSLPPGYAQALIYGLAAHIAPMFVIVAKIPSPLIGSIETKAQLLKAEIQSANAPSPVMRVDGAFSSAGSGYYDILSNR